MRYIKFFARLFFKKAAYPIHNTKENNNETLQYSHAYA